VLQAAILPEFRPRWNQVVRCAAEPWVKFSGLIRPLDIR
jgi:hypothetical protein